MGSACPANGTRYFNSRALRPGCSSLPERRQVPTPPAPVHGRVIIRLNSVAGADDRKSPNHTADWTRPALAVTDGIATTALTPTRNTNFCPKFIWCHRQGVYQRPSGIGGVSMWIYLGIGHDRSRSPTVAALRLLLVCARPKMPSGSTFASAAGCGQPRSLRRSMSA
jgi:hypothetical protein